MYLSYPSQMYLVTSYRPLSFHCCFLDGQVKMMSFILLFLIPVFSSEVFSLLIPRWEISSPGLTPKHFSYITLTVQHFLPCTLRFVYMLLWLFGLVSQYLLVKWLV